MNEEAHPWREELGAYLVGALEADEAERMRAHLTQCPACQAEYAALAPVAGLLSKVPVEAFTSYAEADAAPDPGMWERLSARAGLVGVAESPSDVRLRANPTLPGGQRPGGSPRPPQPSPASRPSSRRARRSTKMRPATAALISGVLVAAAAIGIYAGTRPSSGAPQAAGIETVSAANKVDGVSGTVQYRSTEWGSWVQISLKGVKAGDDCILYAMDGHGNKVAASTWWAPDAVGATATIPGGVAMNASDIQKFQVTTTAGDVLLTVPTS